MLFMLWSLLLMLLIIIAVDIYKHKVKTFKIIIKMILFQDNKSSSEQSYDVLFDQSFPGGLSIRSSAGRSYRVPGSALINITHGERMTDKNKNDKLGWPELL